MVLGFTPRDIDAMSPWEFTACVDGYVTANKREDDAPPPMSGEEAAKLGIVGL